MPWTPNQWDAFAKLLRWSYGGDFPDMAEAAYRAELDNLSPESVVGGYRSWTETFRPTVGDLRGLALAYRPQGLPATPTMQGQIAPRSAELQARYDADDAAHDAEWETWDAAHAAEIAAGIPEQQARQRATAAVDDVKPEGPWDPKREPVGAWQARWEALTLAKLGFSPSTFTADDGALDVELERLQAEFDGPSPTTERTHTHV